MFVTKAKTYPEKPVLNFELEKRLRRPMPLAALKPSTANSLRANPAQCNKFFKEIGATAGLQRPITPITLCNQLLYPPTAARASAASGVLK